jgi:hypothetical protein
LTKNGSFGFAVGAAMCVGAKANVLNVQIAFKSFS